MAEPADSSKVQATTQRPCDLRATAGSGNQAGGSPTAEPVLGRLPIMPAMCSTCPWQTNGQAARLAEGRLAAMEADLREGTTHNCHTVGPRSTAKTGQAHTCRGSVNYMASVGIHNEVDRILAIMVTVDNQP